MHLSPFLRTFDRTCDVPIVAWQFAFYILLLALRVGLYAYTISVRLVKCALIGLLFILLPALTIMTIIGTVLWYKMKTYEFGCVSGFLFHMLTSLMVFSTRQRATHGQ